MIFGEIFLESLYLKANMAMRIFMDNKGEVDVFNNRRSIAGTAKRVQSLLDFPTSENEEQQKFWKQVD